MRYFGKRTRQLISATLSVSMVMGSWMSALAAPPQPESRAGAPLTVETTGYRAELDLEKGSLLLSCNSDKTKDWNTADGITPGATMFLGANDQIREAQMTVGGAFDNTVEDGGAAGISMSGELSGVKSWFLFDSEVVCLGAGIENTGESTDKVINVVDNVAVDSNLKVALPNPWIGYRGVIDATTANDPKKTWSSVLDTVTKGKHARNWLNASGLSGSDQPLEWKYIFADNISNSQIYYRFPTVDGKADRFEMWSEPVKGLYQYTLGVGGVQGDFKSVTTAEVNNKVLSNTKELQAAEILSEGLLAVNKWTTGECEVTGQVANLSLNQPVSVFIRRSEAGDKASITVSKLSTNASDSIEVGVDIIAQAVGSVSDPSAVTASKVEDGKVLLTLDAAKLTQAVTVEVDLIKPENITGDTITMVKGEIATLKQPEELIGQVTWTTKFVKPDGTYIRNVGSSKIKHELKEGQTDGNRTAGDTTAEHLITVKTLSNGDVMLTAREKGNLVLVATDETGKEVVYPTEILFEDPANLPEVTKEDYAQIRETWKESLIGKDIASQEGGAEIVETIDKAAGEIWDTYLFKGKDCTDQPWETQIDPKTGKPVGNADMPYVDDAVEFRPAFKNVLAMAKAYTTEGSGYYQNKDMFDDMIRAMDYLCTVCYTPKSQTDNWWTWEIGIPKDLIPIVILLYNDLTQEQIMTYTEGLYFFQPDPYHEGAIGTGSTHAQGYRTAQGANIIDCSTTAVGLGALREDNELVYMGMLASSQTFVIQEVEDSADIPALGYTSGFYADGSYLDHSHVPYIGSYGIEFMKGGVKIPSLIGGTPWQYPDEVQKNLEYYIVEGFGNSMYRGMMLDSLKGRSVSRPASSNRAAGRDAMSIILQMVDSLSDEARETVLSMMKYWLEEDPEYIDSLKGVENMPIKRKALEILEDNSIEGYVPEMHRSFPLMDRAVHRRDSYLFALSMYSERIQNAEIMNDENKFGWHQGSGMTYIYDGDNQYTDNYWNTVNPLRLAGTTVVPMNIGNGEPDSSGFLQGGDFRSGESWVGGSAIGNYGISGMSFSGEIGGKGKSAAEVAYAPNLKGKKSWFMFDDEIVCLGAGITNKGMDLPVETTVENKKLNEEGDNQLTIDGNVMDLPAKAADIKELVDGSADTTGTPVENVTWAHLAGNNTEGTGYYFPYDDTEIQVRKARTTGNWIDVGTSEGESTQNYMEMWFDHGANPTDASYGYVLLPGKTADETADYAEEPKVAVLMNTAEAQAVYHQDLGITGINFWEDKEVTVGDVTSNKKASVMLKEGDNGTLQVAVSDPTMKNTGTIKITINKPVASEVTMDPNVSCEIQEDGSAVLTFQMKGTNGASSMASLKLEASVFPYAAAMRPGENRTFEVKDYTGNAGEITWSVKGEESLAARTNIDSRGMLWVDQTEKNKALVVTAKTQSGLVLNAYVTLGGDVVTTEVPEDVKKAEMKINEALSLLEKLGAEDPDVQKAVENAVMAVAEADEENVVEHLMDRIPVLVEAYTAVREAMGAPVSERVDITGKGVEALNAKAFGMLLNIPSSYKAGPSAAVLVISGEGGDLGDREDIASPSSATRKTNVYKLSGNNRFSAAEGKSTPSDASKDITEINNEKIDQKSVCKFQTGLFWEKELEEKTSILEQKIPYEVTIRIPESINTESDAVILAAVIDKNGKEHSLKYAINFEEGTLTFYPTTTGTVVFANKAVEKPEEPDKPKPEEPDKPKPEEPDKPKPEEPDKPKPEEPDKPKPEEPDKPASNPVETPSNLDDVLNDPDLGLTDEQKEKVKEKVEEQLKSIEDELNTIAGTEIAGNDKSLITGLDNALSDADLSDVVLKIDSTNATETEVLIVKGKDGKPLLDENGIPVVKVIVKKVVYDISLTYVESGEDVNLSGNTSYISVKVNLPSQIADDANIVKIRHGLAQDKWENLRDGSITRYKNNAPTTVIKTKSFSPFELTLEHRAVPKRRSGGSGSSKKTGVSGSWKQDANGWWFQYTNGGYASDKWEQINGKWYYFNEKGYAVTGWQLINGQWYYLDPVNCDMKTGWHLDSADGKWYYLSGSGAMATGWVEVNGKSYYLSQAATEAAYTYDTASGVWVYANTAARPFGSMYMSETTPDGYQVGADGAWIQ